MAKKFGKFLLITAAAAAACAGAYYYFQNKQKFSADYDGDEDDDYDNFSDDLDDTESTRSYVALNNHEDETAQKDDTAKEEVPFEKLSSLVSDTAEKAEEKIEEFFDEDDDKPIEG